MSYLSYYFFLSYFYRVLLLLLHFGRAQCSVHQGPSKLWGKVKKAGYQDPTMAFCFCKDALPAKAICFLTCMVIFHACVPFLQNQDSTKQLRSRTSPTVQSASRVATSPLPMHTIQDQSKPIPRPRAAHYKLASQQTMILAHKAGGFPFFHVRLERSATVSCMASIQGHKSFTNSPITRLSSPLELRPMKPSSMHKQ